MDEALHLRVGKRAQNRCEYCRLRQEYAGVRHHIEHITARKHGGTDTADNLALACHRCNLHKGANPTGIEPTPGKLTQLYNRRRRRWHSHFRFNGIELTGLTPIGRATVAR